MYYNKAFTPNMEFANNFAQKLYNAAATDNYPNNYCYEIRGFATKISNQYDIHSVINNFHIRRLTDIFTPLTGPTTTGLNNFKDIANHFVDVFAQRLTKAAQSVGSPDRFEFIITGTSKMHRSNKGYLLPGDNYFKIVSVNVPSDKPQINIKLMESDPFAQYWFVNWFLILIGIGGGFGFFMVDNVRLKSYKC